MQCLEFRRVAGADPRDLLQSAAAAEHSVACVRCAEFLRRARLLDARILAALEVPVPPDRDDRMAAPVSVPASAPVAARVSAVTEVAPRRWYALAASIVAGVLVGTLIWVSGPRVSLAEDVLAHMEHEPRAMTATTETPDERELADVLGASGVRITSGVGAVSYARRCWFRGHFVPHVVVQTETGPVTVLVLRHEHPSSAVDFAEQGYAGRIVPADRGSVAVIGTTGADLDAVAARVLDALARNRGD
jgi:hypothetical protein